MSIMEGQKGIPLEEAMKRGNKNYFARSSKKEQRDQSKQALLEQCLDLLRSNISLEKESFITQKALVEFLSKKDFLEQMVTLEKAVEANAVSPEQMIDLFIATRGNNTRMAVVENLPRLKFANSEEKEKALFLLKEIASGRFTDDEMESLRLNGLDGLYLSRYRMDWEKNEDFDIMTTAAIETLSRFGKDAEDYLVEVLKANIERGKPEDMKQRLVLSARANLKKSKPVDIKSIVDFRRYVSSKGDGSLDGLFDKSGFVANDEAKGAFDTTYPYNALVLQKLTHMGSKKGLEFLTEHIPEKDSFDVIYHQEATELLAATLKEAKAAGEIIDYRKAKYLKLYEKPVGEDLPDEEKEEILEMARDTYFSDIFKGNPEAAQRVIDELERELFGLDGLKNQRTYTLKYQRRDIAFCRFKPIEGKPDELYVGSLNVYKDLRGLSVGGYFVRATTEKEAKNHILRAITRKDNVANESYKKCGWEIDKKDSFEKNGVKYFNMVMDRRKK